MPYKRTLVCLANSRKLQGRCVAGLEWNGHKFGAWMRPVSSSGKGELTSERYYPAMGDPHLLDIIEISFLSPKPVGCHIEDHLIDPTTKWVLKGSITSANLAPAIERIGGPLWINAGSTTNGVNDLIPASAASQLQSSLKLVQPDKLTMRLHVEGTDFGNPRRRVRGDFSLNGIAYRLSITDPAIENEFRSKVEGASRMIKQPILCLSISEIFTKQNAHYKLIAGVISPRS